MIVHQILFLNGNFNDDACSLNVYAYYARP